MCETTKWNECAKIVAEKKCHQQMLTDKIVGAVAVVTWCCWSVNKYPSAHIFKQTPALDHTVYLHVYALPLSATTILLLLLLLDAFFFLCCGYYYIKCIVIARHIHTYAHTHGIARNHHVIFKLK